MTADPSEMRNRNKPLLSRQDFGRFFLYAHDVASRAIDAYYALPMGKHLLRVCEEQGSRLNKLRVQNDKLRNEDHIKYDIHKHTPFPAFADRRAITDLLHSETQKHPGRKAARHGKRAARPKGRSRHRVVT